MHNEPKQGAAEVTATPTPKPCWCGPEGCADSRCAGRAKGAITEPKIPPVMLTPEAWAAEAVLRATRQDDLLLAQAMNVEARRYIALGEELDRLREIIGAVQHSDREDIDAALQIAAEGQIQGDTTAYALAAGTLAAEVRRQREMLSPKPCCGDFVSCTEACAVRADHWKDFKTGVSEGTGQIMTPIEATADGQMSAPIMGEPLTRDQFHQLVISQMEFDVLKIGQAVSFDECQHLKTELHAHTRLAPFELSGNEWCALINLAVARYGHRSAPNRSKSPAVEPVTLSDVLDALNLFNKPRPSEGDDPWTEKDFISVKHLPAFINILASASWFTPPLSNAKVVQLHSVIKQVEASGQSIDEAPSAGTAS